jgi:nucleotide-binding universal stress UspA family protein
MSAIVVVGIDGSADSAAALRWAVDYAGRCGARVRAVHVWTPIPWFDSLPDQQRELLAADRARSGEHARLRADAELRGLGAPAGLVEMAVAEGAPGEALVELSRDALLLVVGATGQHSQAGASIGATARYATRHAFCPVTVVGLGRRLPSPADPAGETPPAERRVSR